MNSRSTTMRAVCGHCSSPLSGKPQYCARCKTVAYCNRECQRADWRAHKPKCEVPTAAPTLGCSSVKTSQGQRELAAEKAQALLLKLIRGDADEVDLGCAHAMLGCELASDGSAMSESFARAVTLDATRSARPSPSPHRTKPELPKVLAHSRPLRLQPGRPLTLAPALADLRSVLPGGPTGRLVNSFIFGEHPDAVAAPVSPGTVRHQTHGVPLRPTGGRIWR